MVAINNLHGRVSGVQGKLLYKEALPFGLAFVVVEKFAEADGKTHRGSLLEIDACVACNELHDSGKIHYFGQAISPESVKKELREFKTKDGFLVKEMRGGVCQVDADGKAITRVNEWIIEGVSKSFILNLLKK